MSQKKHKDFRYFVRTTSVVVGIVVVWRGIWHILDEIERIFFGGEVFWTAIVGIILGLLFLYIPDYDLKEIEKL